MFYIILTFAGNFNSSKRKILTDNGLRKLVNLSSGFLRHRILTAIAREELLARAFLYNFFSILLGLQYG